VLFYKGCFFFIAQLQGQASWRVGALPPQTDTTNSASNVILDCQCSE
jgi:hypothetical protein